MKRKVIHIASVIMFYLLLVYSYITFIYPTYKYNNFGLSISVYKLGVSFAVCIFMAIVLYKYIIQNNPYFILVYILYVFIFIPLSVYYGVTDNNTNYYLMNILVFVIFYIMYYILPKNKIEINNKLSKQFLYIVFFVFIIITIYLFIKYGNSISYIFRLEEVYDLRLNARIILPTYATYVIPWTINCIIPIMFFVFFRKRILLAIPFVMTIMLFTIGGNKSYLFTVILFIGIYVMLRKRILYLMVMGLNCIGILLIYSNNLMAKALFFDRVLFLPQLLQYLYYDFFSVNQKMNLSHSIFRFFINNQYGKDTSFLIGDIYFNKVQMSANANFIADAYSNFGLVGIILFTVMLSIIFIIINGLVLNSRNEVLLSVFITSIFALQNSALLTAIGTHGIGLSIIIVLIFGKYIIQVND